MCVCVCVCVWGGGVSRCTSRSLPRLFWWGKGWIFVPDSALNEAQRLGRSCNTYLTEGLTARDTPGTQGTENLRRN